MCTQRALRQGGRPNSAACCARNKRQKATLVFSQSIACISVDTILRMYLRYTGCSKEGALPWVWLVPFSTFSKPSIIIFYFSVVFGGSSYKGRRRELAIPLCRLPSQSFVEWITRLGLLFIKHRAHEEFRGLDYGGRLHTTSSIHRFKQPPSAARGPAPYMLVQV